MTCRIDKLQRMVMIHYFAFDQTCHSMSNCTQKHAVMLQHLRIMCHAVRPLSVISLVIGWQIDSGPEFI